MRAIDLGNYSAIPSQAQVQCLLNQGYTTAIVGSSFGDVSEQQIDAFERNGIAVQEYQFPGATLPTARRWWLDCETPASVVVSIRNICRWGEESRPYGIYTRRGWWVDNTGDWDIKAEFPWLELWDASYISHPLPCVIEQAATGGGDVAKAAQFEMTRAPAFVPYGGFTSRAMHQWHDSTDLCGLNVDLNIIEEEHMPTAEYDNLHETDDAIKAQLLSTAIDLGKRLDALKDAMVRLAQANAGSFGAIENRLTALEKGSGG